MLMGSGVFAHRVPTSNFFLNITNLSILIKKIQVCIAKSLWLRFFSQLPSVGYLWIRKHGRLLRGYGGGQMWGAGGCRRSPCIGVGVPTPAAPVAASSTCRDHECGPLCSTLRSGDTRIPEHPTTRAPQGRSCLGVKAMKMIWETHSACENNGNQF